MYNFAYHLHVQVLKWQKRDFITTEIDVCIPLFDQWIDVDHSLSRWRHHSATVRITKLCFSIQLRIMCSYQGGFYCLMKYRITWATSPARVIPGASRLHAGRRSNLQSLVEQRHVLTVALVHWSACFSGVANTTQAAWNLVYTLPYSAYGFVGVKTIHNLFFWIEYWS